MGTYGGRARHGHKVVMGAQELRRIMLKEFTCWQERSPSQQESSDAGIVGWGSHNSKGNSLGRREKGQCLGDVSQQHCDLESLDWTSERLHWLGVFMPWELSLASRCWVQSRQAASG